MAALSSGVANQCLVDSHMTQKWLHESYKRHRLPGELLLFLSLRRGNISEAILQPWFYTDSKDVWQCLPCRDESLWSRAHVSVSTLRRRASMSIIVCGCLSYRWDVIPMRSTDKINLHRSSNWWTMCLQTDTSNECLWLKLGELPTKSGIVWGRVPLTSYIIILQFWHPDCCRMWGLSHISMIDL